MCSGSQLWWKGVDGDHGGGSKFLMDLIVIDVIDHVIFAEFSSEHILRRPHCITTGPSLAVHVLEVHPFTRSFTPRLLENGDLPAFSH